MEVGDPSDDQDFIVIFAVSGKMWTTCSVLCAFGLSGPPDSIEDDIFEAWISSFLADQRKLVFYEDCFSCFEKGMSLLFIYFLKEAKALLLY